MTTLKAQNTALLLIDVQERINGVMADQSHLARQEVLLETFGILDHPVVTTEQYPKGLGATVPSLAALLPGGAIEKETFSCVRQSQSMKAIENADRQQIVVIGIEAHVCVLQTAIDLLERGYQVHVPHDAVNSRRRADKDWALHRMAAAGATITATESVLFELLERCGTDQFKAVSRLVKKIPVGG